MIFEKFKIEFSRLDPIFSGLNWSDRYTYGLFLAQFYYYVRHSSRIMSLVASRIPEEKETLHHFVLRHALEERGHQSLAKKDLENLGFRIEEFPELSSTKMFYEPQYYKALFCNPIGFYGYAVALEGTSVTRCGDIYKKCSKLYGDNCAQFLRVHAGDDVEHLKESLELLERLSEEDKAAICDNLNQSIDGLVAMCTEINERGKFSALVVRAA